MRATVCKSRGAAVAVAVVAAVVVVAGVAGVAVVVAAEVAAAAAQRGAIAASAKSQGCIPDHIEKRETLWPGSTKSTRPIRVIFVESSLPASARTQGFQNY
jgi:hypothetical protein